MQLSIFDLVPDPLPTQLRYPNPRKAQKLRELAASLQSQIDKKLDPAISHQRPTRRRAGILSVITVGKTRLSTASSPIEPGIGTASWNGRT